MSKVGDNLLASAIECGHISTKLNTKRTEWIVWCCSHPSNPCELLTQWTGSLRLSGIGALLCYGGVGHPAPRAQDSPSVCPLSGLGIFALNQERNKDLSPFPSCSSVPNIGNIGLVIREKILEVIYLQILRVHPCHPTPGNTYSLSAPHKPKLSLSLEEGCKIRKIIPVKMNCWQNKRQFKIASLSQIIFIFLLFLL